MGVFATRSPFRPNHLGLSCVSFLGLSRTKEFGTTLLVGGADLMDGTPIFDIKPYIPYCDSHPDALAGFTESADDYLLRVDFPADLLMRFPQNEQAAVMGVLSHDPRPSYQHRSDRVYGIKFAGRDIRFTVEDRTAHVISVDQL